jgi:DNA-binding SARP family transcriptional activator/tetratricopeptide (TPR) repeat protein
VTADDGSLAAMVTGLFDALRLQVPALSAGALPGGTRGPDADAEQPIRALAYAGAIADTLEANLTEDLVLVLDDLHEIGPGDPAARLVEGLVRVAPPLLHVVISSRTPAPFRVERLRGRGQLLEIDGSTLAFTDEETAAVLQTVLGTGEAHLAEVLHAAVQGWPAAARLAGEALRAVPPAERDTRLRRALRPGGPVFDYLAEEVFGSEPDDVRRLVAVAAVLPAVSADLCADLGLPAGEALDGLEARGFVASDENGESYRLHPLLRDFALARLALDPDDRAALVVGAAHWSAEQGQDREALALFRQAGATDEVAGLLVRRGPAMVARGDAEEVVAAIGTLPGELRDDAIEQLDGEARQVLGDWEGARACFERLVGDGPIPAAIAWRLGLIHYVRGELAEAVTTYRRGVIDGERPAEEARLLAWWSSAHWLRGEFDVARELAARALTGAKAAADDRALAVAHTVLAMLAATDSDPRANAAHYLRGLDHAERAGDALQQIRIRVNRGSHYIAEARYPQGIAEVDVAIRIADLAGFAMFRALAMNNRGEALLGLGRLDEAIAELERSRALYQRCESRLVAQPLANLGEVYRMRGDLAMARACYEEAVAVADQNRNVQALVPALAGLARIRVEDEPDAALELAERAVDAGAGLGHTRALLGLGWVTLHRGEVDAASGAASEAAALCRRRRDKAGLAEALELQAAILAQGNGQPEPLLQEALTIRREIGDPLGEARAELMLARVASGDGARELALRAHQRFLDAGAARYAATALSTDDSPPVRIECLGGFRVLRAGRPVPLRDWPSRKARDLLKILVSRRCRPVPRTQLVDLLWPDDDEAVASPRLSVALSTVRSVLDPDKKYAADRFVRADRAAVWLDGTEAAVDVEEFLRDARAGLDGGGSSRSVLVLRAAEAAYAGDFLEEDVYADWAGGLRDEARVAYVRVARALADRAAATGDHDGAAGYLLRILQRDVYDERAHLALVRSFVGGGAHGEARRAYRAYVTRMEELGVEPAPFPAGPERDFKAV